MAFQERTCRQGKLCANVLQELSIGQIGSRMHPRVCEYATTCSNQFHVCGREGLGG